LSPGRGSEIDSVPTATVVLLPAATLVAADVPVAAHTNISAGCLTDGGSACGPVQLSTLPPPPPCVIRLVAPVSPIGGPGTLDGHVRDGSPRRTASRACVVPRCCSPTRVGSH
jgi:hypothetical protein